MNETYDDEFRNALLPPVPVALERPYPLIERLRTLVSGTSRERAIARTALLAEGEAVRSELYRLLAFETSTSLDAGLRQEARSILEAINRRFAIRLVRDLYLGAPDARARALAHFFQLQTQSWLGSSSAGDLLDSMARYTPVVLVQAFGDSDDSVRNAFLDFIWRETVPAKQIAYLRSIIRGGGQQLQERFNEVLESLAQRIIVALSTADLPHDEHVRLQDLLLALGPTVAPLVRQELMRTDNAHLRSTLDGLLSILAPVRRERAQMPRSAIART